MEPVDGRARPVQGKVLANPAAIWKARRLQGGGGSGASRITAVSRFRGTQNGRWAEGGPVMRKGSSSSHTGSIFLIEVYSTVKNRTYLRCMIWCTHTYTVKLSPYSS